MDKIDITQDGLEKLLNQFVKNAEEERELALDRYRRQDEMIITPDDFVLQGKNAVDYLKTASERSNSILAAAKLLKDILYSSEGGNVSSGGLNDEVKEEIIKQVRQSD